MKVKLSFNFLQRFDGVIWNLLAAPARPVLLIEVRNNQKKEVSFSALDYHQNTFLWHGRKLEESWWINLTAVFKDIILFTYYMDTANPDKKGILAYDLVTLSLLWWNNDFSLSSCHNDRLYGFATKFGSKEVVLELGSGKVLEKNVHLEATHDEKNILKPVQYAEGSPHFDTIKKFLTQKLNFKPESAFEYLEHNSLVFISYYEIDDGLANYLIVLSVEGDVLLKEKIGQQLQGIGLGTFFILDRCLFFVKNKVELVSYKMYDQ